MDNVPQEVIEALADVRESGRINMFDYVGAVKLASLLGHYEAADWLQENKNRYMDALNAMGRYVTDLEDGE